MQLLEHPVLQLFETGLQYYPDLGFVRRCGKIARIHLPVENDEKAIYG
jgi:hypothetical protein